MNPSYDAEPVIDDPRITQQVRAVFDQNAPQPTPAPHPMESFGSSFFTPVTNFGITGAQGPTGPAGGNQDVMNYALGLVGANPTISSGKVPSMSAPDIGGIPRGIGRGLAYSAAAAVKALPSEQDIAGDLRNAETNPLGSLAQLAIGRPLQVASAPFAGGVEALHQAGIVGDTTEALNTLGGALGPAAPEAARVSTRGAAELARDVPGAAAEAARTAISPEFLRDQAGQARVDLGLTGSKKPASYTQAQVDAVFGDANAARVTAAASGMPKAAQDAVRQMSLDPKSGLTAELIASNDKMLPLIDRSLQANGAEITDANRLEVAQQMLGKSQVVAEINAARGGPKIELTDPVIADAVARAGPAAAPVVQRAQAAAAQISGSSKNYGKIVEQMRAAGATEEEITGFVGKGNVPPPPRGPQAPGGSANPPPPGRPNSTPSFTADTAWKVMNQIVYSGIILPTTNLLHPFGSITSSLLHFPEQVLLSGADALAHGIGLTKDRHFTLQASVNAFKSQMVGTGEALAHGLPQILKPLEEVLTDSDVPKEIGSALVAGEYGKSLGLRGAGVATQLLSANNLPMRALSLLDNALIRGLTDSSLMRSGYEQGMRQGLKGRALDAFAMTYRSAASDELIAQAVTEAKTQINRQAPGSAASGVLRVKNAAGPIGTILLPFFNTRLNILKAATTWSPLGFARLLPADLPLNLGYFGRNTTTEAARIQAVTRAGIGTLALYSIWQQVLSDNITGDGPEDPREKAIWAGDPNNPSHITRSLRLPTGQWMTYGKIPVFGDLIAGIADTAEAVRGNKAKDVSGARAAVVGLVNFFANEEQGLVNALATLGALADFRKNPSDKQAQAELAQQMADRGFEITPYSGVIRSFGTVGDPRYESATSGQSGVGRLRADYAAHFPAGIAPGVAGVLGGQPGDVKEGTQRVPGVTGGAGALLPMRISGPTSIPVEGQAAGMPPTLSAESTRLASKLTDFKPPQAPDQKIGPPDNQVRLSGSDYISFLGYAGQARNDAVNKLLLSKPYQDATPDIQGRLLRNTVVAADKAGEAEFLKNGVLRGLDPASAKQQVILGLAAVPTMRDKANWLSLIDRAGKLTTEIRQAVDASRTPPLPGQPTSPTVSEYLHAAPLVNTYLAMKPYLIGNPEQWVQVGIARSQMAAYLRDHPAPMGVPQVDWFQQHNPVPGALIRQYSYAQVKNPQRDIYLKQHPEIARFVGNTSLTQATAPQ